MGTVLMLPRLNEEKIFVLMKYFLSLTSFLVFMLTATAFS